MSGRLLHVVPSLAEGRTMTRVRLLSRALGHRGWQVGIASLRADGTARGPGDDGELVDLTTGPERRHRAVQLLTLPARVRAFDPQVIHCWSPAVRSLANGLASRLRATSRSVPVIQQYRSATPMASVPMGWLERRIGPADVCFVGDDPPPAELRAGSGRAGTSEDGSGMIAIPPGVPHFAGSRAAARQRLLAQYQLPEQAKLVATVGPLIAGRFVKELIWAADLLKAVGESFYLLIVGDGPHSWRLARYRDQVRLRDRVRLLGQIADPMDVLAGCDVLWRAGDDGGISQSLLEAAAVGTPVIASDTAAHRRLISAGQTGWLVPDQDRAAFARRTLQVVAEPSVAAAVAADAQRRVRAEFSVETMTEGFQQAYVRAIQAAR